jgi:hypothetical protein
LLGEGAKTDWLCSAICCRSGASKNGFKALINHDNESEK